MGSTSGEVICDSILQNKQKTKSYWEQLMMAAVTSEELGRTSHHTTDGGQSSYTMKHKDMLYLSGNGEDSKSQSELSEQELYGASSQRSPSSPPEHLDSISNRATVPKVVKSVTKKVSSEAEAIETKHDHINGEESVIEREIRLQKNKEEAVAKERQEAQEDLLRVAVLSQQTSAHETLQQQNKHALVAKNSVSAVLPNGETKIALEILEMRRKEEELRRQRQKLLISNGSSQIKEASQGPETVFNKLGNKDEENCAEYDSDKKELIVNETVSCSTSPEVCVSQHQRTQSMESVSSSHSSGSGVFAGCFTRRRITVKPLADPEDEDTPAYMRNQKETPIEREIRLAFEREEEFRQEKRLSSLSALPPVAPPTAPEVVRFDDLAECGAVEREEKIKKCVSASDIPSAVMQMNTRADTSRPAAEQQKRALHFPISQKSVQSTSIFMDSRKFPNSQRQKGLMQRFIASRGKINGIASSIVTSPPVTAQNLSPSYTNTLQYKATDTSLEQAFQYSEGEKEAFETQRSQIRRGHISAEKKIQAELLEMQKREEELRLQRASLFAQSQPNLLCMGEGDNDSEETSGAVDTQTQLRNSLSNPNLLDSENYIAIHDDPSLKKPSGKTARRRSALIAQWENRIQQFTEQ